MLDSRARTKVTADGTDGGPKLACEAQPRAARREIITKLPPNGDPFAVIQQPIERAKAKHAGLVGEGDHQ